MRFEVLVGRIDSYWVAASQIVKGEQILSEVGVGAAVWYSMDALHSRSEIQTRSVDGVGRELWNSLRLQLWMVVQTRSLVPFNGCD